MLTVILKLHFLTTSFPIITILEILISLNFHNDDRNFLVHHFAEKWKFNDSSHTREATKWLTDQFDIVFKIFIILIETMNLIKERSKKFLDLLTQNHLKM